MLNAANYSLRTSLGFEIKVRASRNLRWTVDEFRKVISGRYRGEMQRSMNMLSLAAPELGKQAQSSFPESPGR